jgi:uncharacterized protein (TIGR02266 family)
MADDPNRRSYPGVPPGTGQPSSTQPQRHSSGTFPAVMPGTGRPSGTNPSMPAMRDPRSLVVVPVRYRFSSIIDFIGTHSINVSRSGMFITSNEPAAIGTVLDFEFALADGFSLLKGKGEVVRLSASPRGMGVRFQQLDDASRKLIDRIVEVNTREGKRSVVPLEFAEAPAPTSSARGGAGAGSGSSIGVDFTGRDLRSTPARPPISRTIRCSTFG